MANGVVSAARQTQKPTSFRAFQEDTTEILSKCFKSDYQLVNVFSKIEIDERDRRVVDLVIKENYTTIKDLYHFV